MNAVVDTNVFVSGLFFGGKPRLIIEQWIARRFDVLVTPEIIDEYLSVIYDFGRRRGESIRQDVMDALDEQVIFVKSTTTGSLCRDPDDDKFIHCAVSSGADAIVSGDRDLLSLGTVSGIPIFTVGEFLRRLG